MDSSSKGLIVFCQAPADVQYVLTLYEKYHQKFQIILVVINQEGIYHYFQSLGLSFNKILLIPYPKNIPLKDAKKLFKIKSWLYNNYNSFFSEITGHSVYFFSKYFDWLTGFFISRLSINNSVFLADHSGQTFIGTKEANGILILYRRLIFRFLTSVNFRFLKMQSTLMMEFPVENYNISSTDFIPDESIYSKYCVKTDTGSGKSVLLFESNQKAYDFYLDYKSTILDVIQEFKASGYKIFLKPHPRQGYSEFLKPHVEKILPAEVPGEFFNPDDFTLITGIDSNAVAYFAKKYQQKTLSLLNLFNFKREEEKERFRQTQVKLSDSQVSFISSFTELQKKVMSN
jgi:hypothetical protein